MFLKNLFLLLFFFTVTSTIAQTFKGRVMDNNEHPISGVDITVKGSSIETISDSNGYFNLNISKEQVLVISHIGFKTKEILATPSKKSISITLYEGNELLQELETEGKRANAFSRKETAYVSKLPLKDLDNSQVYSTVTNELLTSQGVTTFAEALQNAVGVEKLWQSTGRSGDGAGYYTIRGFSTQPRLVDGVPGNTNGFINPATVERIEVIKGPSATLFGNLVSSYGGLINIVTKKPYQQTGGNIQVSTGSYGFHKVAGDFNVSSKKSKKLSFRINTGYQKEDSWQDAGFNKSFFISPAASYKVNNRLTLNFRYEYSKNEQTNSVFLFLNRYSDLAFHSIEELNYDYDKSLTDNSVTIKNPTHNLRAEAVYKITDNWSSQSIVSAGKAKSDGYYTYLWNYADWSTGTAVDTPYFALYAQKTDAETNILDLQQNFTGDFKLGNIRNRLVLGVDYLSYQIVDNSSGWSAINAVTAQGDIISGVEVNQTNIDTALASVSYSNSDTNQNFLGVYVSDVINLFPQLSMIAGVRFDQFNYKGDKNDSSDDEKSYVKNTFSPKFGIVYQPVLNQLSIFSNYQNGFSYVDPELVPIDETDPTAGTILQTYDLEQANQFEFGVKTNLLKNKVNAMLSYYDITVKDKVMGYGTSKVQDGTVRSKGVELEVNTSPISGLNMRIGLSYNDAKVTESESTPSLVGKRLAQAGPAFSYNFWADYRFVKGSLKHFGLGAGFNGAGEYNTMVGYPVSGDFYLPSYTIFNASLYFDSKKFRLAINGRNLADKEYYKGWSTVTPQKPRSVMATFTYKF